MKVAAAVMTYVDERLAVNPHRLRKPLTDELSGMRTARNGDYRILFEIDEGARALLMVRVDHRSRVYRSR